MTTRKICLFGSSETLDAGRKTWSDDSARRHAFSAKHIGQMTMKLKRLSVRENEDWLFDSNIEYFVVGEDRTSFVAYGHSLSRINRNVLGASVYLSACDVGRYRQRSPLPISVHSQSPRWCWNGYQQCTIVLFAISRLGTRQVRTDRQTMQRVQKVPSTTDTSLIIDTSMTFAVAMDRIDSGPSLGIARNSLHIDCVIPSRLYISWIPVDLRLYTSSDTGEELPFCVTPYVYPFTWTRHNAEETISYDNVYLSARSLGEQQQQAARWISPFDGKCKNKSD